METHHWIARHRRRHAAQHEHQLPVAGRNVLQRPGRDHLLHGHAQRGAVLERVPNQQVGHRREANVAGRLAHVEQQRDATRLRKHLGVRVARRQANGEAHQRVQRVAVHALAQTHQTDARLDQGGHVELLEADQNVRVQLGRFDERSSGGVGAAGRRRLAGGRTAGRRRTGGLVSDGHCLERERER